MKEHYKFFLNSLSETKSFAMRLSKLITFRKCICLKGKLGIGKTTLVRFMLNSYNKKPIKVTSPTFSLVNIYDLKKIRVWHYDLYRIKKKIEVYNLDLELALNDCTIIEWPEIVEDILPNDRINLTLEERSKDIIEVTLSSKNIILL